MSKRTDTIKTLFAAPAASVLSADNSPRPRVTAGSVRSVRETFSEVERENEDLRKQIAESAHVVEIEADLIDPSPLTDRLREDADPSFELLKQSIAQRGQEVPVLLRRHPSVPGRYQSAYGHRRVRAARELGLVVKAIVREMSDEDLVIAQGLENSPREDLSFIERALFAMRIEDAGHNRSVIQDALAVDRAEASKLLAVARAVPPTIVLVIGRAPKVGRGRWQALADLLKDRSAVARAMAATEAPGFRERPTDLRFLAVFSAAENRTRTSVERVRAIVSFAGEKFAYARIDRNTLRLDLDSEAAPTFAKYVLQQLPALFDAYSRSSGDDEKPGA